MSLSKENATDLLVCANMLGEVSESVNQFNATKIEMIQDKINKIIVTEGLDLPALVIVCKEK